MELRCRQLLIAVCTVPFCCTPASAEPWNARRDLLLVPALLQVELQPGETRQVKFTLVSSLRHRARLLAAHSDCRCVRVADLPRVLAAGQQVSLTVDVAGTRAGSKHLAIETDRGTASATLQIVIDGRGTAREELRQLAKQMQASQHLLVLVRTPGESPACCGRQEGPSLDRGRLESALNLFADTSTTCLLCCDVDQADRLTWLKKGKRTQSFVARLSPDEPVTFKAATKELSIAVSDAVQEDLQKYDLVVALGATSVRNVRVITPRLPGGLELILLDERGRPLWHRAIPLDSSLDEREGLSK